MMPTKNFLELGLCDSTLFRTLMQSAASIPVHPYKRTVHEQREQRVNKKSSQQHRLDEHEKEKQMYAENLLLISH